MSEPAPAPTLTSLGRLLEDARERLGLSKREAAKLAGISEGRWRQVVTGVQKARDVNVAVNPRRNTVTAMATAVRVDPSTALEAAGMSPLTDRDTTQPVADDPAMVKVMRSSLPEDKKRRLIALLIEEREAYIQQRMQRTDELIDMFDVEG